MASPMSQGGRKGCGRLKLRSLLHIFTAPGYGEPVRIEINGLPMDLQLIMGNYLFIHSIQLHR